ncbi:Methyltransferase [Datura stramonium]|uniref:Methyltransferase n=1 Tax=Datura stramonium TaxID=4076 RepID=A0ABS8T494_DATST|nr:Methyltransferase [Datura stramonium]
MDSFTHLYASLLATPYRTGLSSAALRKSKPPIKSPHSSILSIISLPIFTNGLVSLFTLFPSIPGKSHREATRIHEEMAVDLLGVKPGARILDAGCGVGGPMRAIAAHSGANVVGITINDASGESSPDAQQKSRARFPLRSCTAGILLQMFLQTNVLTGHPIEATCHAPKLEEEVY